MNQEQVSLNADQLPQWSFLVTPWEKDFLLRCHDAKRTIRFACPFIKLRNIRLVLASISSKLQRPLRFELLTRLNLRDCRNRVHDLSALQLLLGNPISSHCKIAVRFNNNLHAKLYIFDNAEAIITSSNLTYSGFHRNLEVALATHHQEIVQSATSYFSEEFSRAKVLTDKLLSKAISELRGMTVSVPLRQEVEFVEEVEMDTLQISTVDTEELEVLDDDVIADIDTQVSENLEKELIDSTCILESDITDAESIETVSERRFIEDYQRRFLTVFGQPLPSEEDVVNICAHDSVYNCLTSVKPNSKLAKTWMEVGMSVYITVLTEYLFRSRPSASGWDLSATRSFIQSSDHLIHQLNELGLCAVIVSESVRKEKKVIKKIMRQAACRLFGYLVKSRSWEQIRDNAENILCIDESFPFESYKDHIYKTTLQHITQERSMGSIEYVVLSKEGPDHDSKFEVAVKIGSRILGTGQGRSKKTAGTIAAHEALKAIGASQELPQTKYIEKLPKSLLGPYSDIGQDVIRRMTGKTISDDLMKAVLIPASMYISAFKRRDAIAALGGVVRELLALRQTIEVSVDDFSLYRSYANSNKRILEIVKKTPLYDWLNTLSRHEGFQDVIQPQVVEQTVNALIGAVFLEHSLQGCASLSSLLFSEISSYRLESITPARTRMRNAAQAVLKNRYDSVVKFEYTPLHSRSEAINPRFLAVVRIEGKEMGRGVAKRKKDAAEKASAEVLANPDFEGLLERLQEQQSE